MRKVGLIILASLFLQFTVKSQTETSVFFGNGAQSPNIEVLLNQTDGTNVLIKQMGDGVINWIESHEGIKLLKNENGILEYAKLDEHNYMINSGVKYRNITERTYEELEFINNVAKNQNIFYSENQIQKLKQLSYLGKGVDATKMGGMPTTGTRKMLVILARFSDQTATFTQTQFNNLMNQAGYDGFGSVKDYYYENSYGLLTLNSTVVGWVTLPNTRAYYGANMTSTGGSDSRPAQLVRDAVIAANNLGIDFSQFDNNSDGTVDGVAVFHSGLGEEVSGDGNDIWSHNWSLASAGLAVTIDGKTVSNYTLQPEKYYGTTMSNIGIICHELGHNLGLPDYYDTNYATGGSYTGTGSWDVMAGGSWNNSGACPAHHNAWSKMMLGWVTPTTLSTPQTVSMTNVEQNKVVYKILTSTSGDYFLLENRQKVGFDQYIAGSGLMVYHVNPLIMNYYSSNTINTTHPQRLYIVNANATVDPKGGSYGTINSAAATFPGTGNKTSLTDVTIPNLKSWANANSSASLTTITNNTTTKIVTFKYNGGSTSTSSAPTSTTVAASNITTTDVKLNGTVNANNNSTTITFEIGTSSTNLGWVFSGIPSSVTGTTSTATYCSLTGLTPNTYYYYRVKAVNSYGTSYGSVLSFKTVSTSTSSAPTATTVAASNITTTDVKLNGTVNANNNSTTITFEIGTSSTSLGWAFSGIPSSVTGTTSTATYCSLTGLTPNTYYYYRVKAVNSYGTSYGSVLSFKTVSTSTSSAPTATTVSASYVTATTGRLNSTVNANNSTSTITFEVGTSSTNLGWVFSGIPSSVTGTTNTASYCDLEGFAPNTYYYYRVKAVNSYGTSYGSVLSLKTSSSKNAQVYLEPRETIISDFKLDVSVYPNPSEGFVKLKINVDLVNVEIFNLLGEKQLTFENVTNDQELDLSALKKGFYLVRNTKENYISTQKIEIK